MTDLERANLNIANSIINFCNKEQENTDNKSIITDITEGNPDKLALQIDNDIRESLPPQMMAVVCGVLKLIKDLE